jgi:hypothetical protein
VLIWLAGEAAVVRHSLKYRGPSKHYVHTL